MPISNPAPVTAAIVAHAAISDAHQTARKVATGSYAGNDSDDRQISVGFKCSFVFLIYDAAYTSSAIAIAGLTDGLKIYDASQVASLTLHGTDGFIVDQTIFNATGCTYYYWAISE